MQAFVELVHSSNGTTQRGKEHGDLPERKTTLRRGEKRNASVVPSHFIQTGVSEIKGETLIFSDMMFYFVNLPAASSLESLHKLVAENGGTFSMNLNNSVTHCIAAESKGIKYQAAKRHGDIIHYSWVLDCCAQKKLLPLLPNYLVTIMGLAIPWSFTLGIVDGYSALVKCPIRQPGILVIIVLGDWVLSALMLAAASSTAGVVDLLLHSNGSFFPSKFCFRYQLFAVMAFASWFLSMALSLFNLWLLLSS